MLRRLLTFAVVAGFTAAGCASRSESPRAGASSAAPAEPTRPEPGDLPAHGRAPVVIRIDGPERVAPGDEINVRIMVERTFVGDPLDFKIALPPGVELVSGQAQERITSDSPRWERSLVVRLTDGVPATDLEVSVDSRGTGYGVHATSAYRFGRPEPKLAQPPRSRRPVMVRGRSMGSPIPLGN